MKIALIIGLVLVVLLPRSLEIHTQVQGDPMELSLESHANPIQTMVLNLMRVEATDFSLNIAIGDHCLRLSQKFAPPHRSFFTLSAFLRPTGCPVTAPRIPTGEGWVALARAALQSW